MANTFGFGKGVHPNPCKELTENLRIKVMEAPERVFIPVSQHLGAPSKVLVKAGDKVKIGTKLAECGGFVSANTFSSVSGEVIGIVKKYSPVGSLVDHIEIQNDGKDTTAFLKPLKNPTAAEIIERSKDAGLVGMGGAGFPTNVKLTPPPDKKVDSLIINAAECEPYLTCDYRLMIEQADKIIKGARYLATALNVKNIYIGVEDNKPEGIAALQKKAGKGINVVELKTRYPQGAEKQLIYALLKRKVPCGKLPADAGAVVQNAGTAVALCEAIEEGKPLYERVLTVSGHAAKNPMNLLVRTGTLYSDLAALCKVDENELKQIISGGPMMGYAVANADIAVSKTTSGVLFFNDKDVHEKEQTNCINCGKCVSVCPMNINPVYIARYYEAGNYDEAERYGALNCIECGSCSYVCPAARPLVQDIRGAKKEINRIKKEGKK